MNDPCQIPISFYQGETYAPPTISWIDVNGNPVDLTGYSAILQARQTVASVNPPVINVSSTSGNIILGDQAGTINIVLGSGLTGVLPAPWCGVWDLFVYSPAGVVTRLIGGSVNIKEPVTRP